MNELITGASYPAKRNALIAVRESEGGALMAYIPYALTGVAYSGTQKVCLYQKNGQEQEVALQNMHDIFGWNTENPFDLQRIPLLEGNGPEFILADWHNEPFVPNGKTEEVDSWCFRWINKSGSGFRQSTDEEERAALAKWGKKFSFSPSAPKKEASPVATRDPAKAEKKDTTRKLPAKKSAEPRFKEPLEVLTALTKKIHPDHWDKTTEAEDNAIANDHWFPAQDKLFGTNNLAETPEQLEQLAVELGL